MAVKNSNSKDEPDLQEEERKSNIKQFYQSELWRAISNGLIGPFLPLFAFQLNATRFMLGLLRSLPQFGNLVMQIVWSTLAEVVAKKKWLVVLGWLTWSLMWVPIAYAQTPGRLVFFVTIQAILGAMSTPAWTALLIKNSPGYKRGKITGRLNRYSGIGTFIGNIVAGFLLNTYGFVPFIFFMATFLGFIGIIIFSSLKEKPKVIHPEEIKMLDIRLTGLNFRKNKKLWNLTIAISALKFAQYLPSAFWAIYIVNNLGGSAIDVAAIAAIGTAVSIIFYRSWGAIIDYLGRKVVLVSCIIPICFFPLAYALANHVIWVYAYTIISSISWAGFNLAAFAYLSDVVPQRKMSSHIAYYNMFTGLSIAVAPFIGGIIAELTSIWIVFIASTLGRIASICLFDRLEEKTGVRPQPLFQFEFHLFGLEKRLNTFAMTYSMAIEGVRKEINGYKKEIEEMKKEIDGYDFLLLPTEEDEDTN